MRPLTANWIIGILGVWIILVCFLGFSSTLTKFFLILSGAAIAFLSYRLMPILKNIFPEYPKKETESEIMPPKNEAETETEELVSMSEEISQTKEGGKK